MKVFVEADFRSLNKVGEELCGDRVAVSRSAEGFTVVMADGLGSGVKANILATLTTSIAGTMLAQGAPIHEVVETMVATLPTCQVRRLAYSTFTILQVAPSGEARLVEFDNPPAFVVRRGSLLDLERVERQVGPRKVHESRFAAEVGDFICIVSDGVVHAGVGGVLNLGWGLDAVGEYVRRIATDQSAAAGVVGLLSSACDNLFMHRPGDDATVVGVRLREPVGVTLFTGPPEDPRADADLVRRLMRSQQRTVVCGGTAAGIVSRELGREVITSLDLIDPAVPPMAHIEGIDLVTEGVLTLSRAIDLIRGAAADPGARLTSLGGADGASRLAKLLLDECTNLTLLVGRGVNPAHQNPGLPHNLSIKVRVVEELRDLLVSHGKDVSMELW